MTTIDPTPPTSTPPTKRPIPYYGWGRTPMIACQADQRFSYCLYVPEDYDADGDRWYRVIVAVHGTERGVQYYRDAFAGLATETGCIVLAPLFPVSIVFDGELDAYKFIDLGGIRFDHVLLSMVDEVADHYRIDGRRLLMYGFSGGGHFTHRFLYLHPERLEAASIGAPGIVTLLDDRFDYWAGVRNVPERFGVPLDLDAMRAVSVQTVIGGDDTQTWEIAMSPDDDWWVDGAQHQGETRLDRIAALADSLARHGIEVERRIVPGIDHDDVELVPVVREFFRSALNATPGEQHTNDR
ncbi:MAG: alpha/beta hydrolase [Actinomycetota bacterium]|nr:alpha/beta hydrolase [Actinomycetota bacterium]